MSNNFIIQDHILKKYTGNAENIVITSEDADIIGYEAFRCCDTVRTLTLKGSFRSIESLAFAGCSNLEKVVVNGNTDTIGSGAFFRCRKLRDLELTGVVKVIEENAFCCCESFDPENSYLFDNIRMVGDYAFKGSGTFSIDLSDRVNHIIWGTGVFSCCNKLKRVIVTDYVPKKMFAGCYKLKEVEFLGTQCIDKEAFKDCAALKEIDLSRVQNCSVGYEAFAGCTGLKKIALPEEYGNIGEKTFYGCTGLEEITLPDKMDSISTGAFACCINLRTVSMGNKVGFISHYAFRDCISLESVRVGQNVRWIGKEAFFGCRNLTSIDIPDSVEKIDDNAFAECDKLSLSVNPAILKPGSDIFGSTYGLDDADEISDSDVGAAILRDEIEEKLNGCGKIVFYDSETTGLDADKCELIRVVAEKYNVEYSSDSNTYILSDREDIDIFIRPAVPMSTDVENITGITNEMLTDKPNEKEAFEAIKAVFCEADLIVGHSTKFELPFFKAMFERCGSSFDNSKPIEDTYLLAKALIPKHKIRWHYSLRNVSAYFGAGKADNDAAKVRKVYIGLAGIAGVYSATT